MASFARLFCRPPLRQQNLILSAKYSVATRKSPTAYVHTWQRSSARWLGVAGGIGLGLVGSAFAVPVYCEGATSPRPPSPPAAGEPPLEQQPAASDPPPPPPPASILNLYELSFGTVAGICAGVFIKKGIKAVAFFVGGVFVLLQVSSKCQKKN